MIEGEPFRQYAWKETIKKQIQLAMLSENAIPYEVSDKLSPAEFKIAYDYAVTLREKRNEEEKKAYERATRGRK